MSIFDDVPGIVKDIGTVYQSAAAQASGALFSLSAQSSMSFR